MSGPITRGYADMVRDRVAQWPEAASIGDLESTLRVLAKWRAQVLGQTYVARQGTTIMGGLFAGMAYVAEPSEGSVISRLLGAYEAALQPHLRRIVEGGVEGVIDVGCAEGYYAVGLARAWPHLTVHAYDIDPVARAKCAELAEKNGVSDRVRIGEAFAPEDFQRFDGRRMLVLIDTEGAEVDILDPACAPALAGMSIVVETHDAQRPGALATLRERFASTHQVQQVNGVLTPVALPGWLTDLSELDQLLAQWEWRHRLTPWLVMEPLSPR